MSEEESPQSSVEQELQRLNEELSRSNADLERFAAVASHDLQEPLRKIRAFGDRLATKYADDLPERGQDYLERMLSAASRMSRLIDSLLTFSRLATKEGPFEMVDLDEILAEVVADLEVRIEENDGRVEVGELPVIEADPNQMRQLFQNLVGNALKFHREGVPPRVRITCERVADEPDERYRIVVEDNGIGFDEKYLDRVFDVFQRLHGRGVYEGTGMGLAICRRIVERHGGEITATSTPGGGSTFIITLPTRPTRVAPEEVDNG